MDSQYETTTFIAEGLPAFWDETPLSKAPILVVQWGISSWFYVDLRLWQCMRRVGIRKALRHYENMAELFPWRPK